MYNIYNYPFATDKSANCVWNENLKALNENFIQNIDYEYYRFIAESNLSIIEREESTERHRIYASLNLRNYYSIGLEAMFSLIFATLQAPKCIPAWLLKYRNKDLYSLVGKINKRQTIYTEFGDIKNKISWESIVNLIFSFLNDEKLKKEIVENYREAIYNFAIDFLNEKFQSENNSIKHGFRIRGGGFRLGLKSVTKEGKEIEGKDWYTIMDSNYGSSFYLSEKINTENFRIKTLSKNWHPENFYHALYLISYVILNIRVFLCTFLKINLSDNKYMNLKSETFDLPWAQMKGLGEIGGIEYDVDFTKIKSAYQRRNISNL